MDTFATPLGSPFHAVDFFKGTAAQIIVIHANEPLLGGAEDHWIFAAPAMRVTVDILGVAHQSVFLGENFDDYGIGLEDGLAHVLRRAFREAAFIVKRRVGFELVALAGVEVVGAMARRGVNDAAALLDGHVVGKDAGNLIIEERMLEFQAFEFGTFSLPTRLIEFDDEFFTDSLEAIGSEQKGPFGTLCDDVIEIGMEGEGAIGRERPRRGGPDECVYAGAKFCGGAIRDKGKFNPDRVAGVVVVFHFGFGESGFIEETPVDGLEAAVNVALLEKDQESFGDGRFVSRIHSEIGLIPLAKDAEALKIAAIGVDIAGGVIAAPASKFSRGDFGFVAAEFLFDFVLDGQAVAIPSGNVG